MIKKAIIAGVAAAGIGTAFLGYDVFSYVGTSYGRVKESVKSSVPMDFEIDRARKMVRDIVPEIRKHMHLVAKEEVEVERLNRQIADAETRLGRDRTELMRLKTDLAGENPTFEYAGHKYTVQQVKLDLANRFERYKVQDATLASLREMHGVRERSLEAARQKLEGMLVSKRQLAVEVENLEARLKMVEARHTTSDFAFDDSHLSRCKELIGDLRSRLTVEERVVNAEGDFEETIPLDTEAPEDILKQVTEYFEPAEPAAVQVATDDSAL